MSPRFHRANNTDPSASIGGQSQEHIHSLFNPRHIPRSEAPLDDIDANLQVTYPFFSTQRFSPSDVKVNVFNGNQPSAVYQPVVVSPSSTEFRRVLHLGVFSAQQNTWDATFLIGRSIAESIPIFGGQGQDLNPGAGFGCAPFYLPPEFGVFLHVDGTMGQSILWGSMTISLQLGERAPDL